MNLKRHAASILTTLFAAPSLLAHPGADTGAGPIAHALAHALPVAALAPVVLLVLAILVRSRTNPRES